ncbi:hypothetical protein HYPSUDRAFT_520232 [Hypholoma sublateritium FD-334 SS-4]|uniref:NACHT domain-containing protein n=1 Tax=Hypholoma sublateritium (strain FD-334 SS-4) TaxID=945553 RepID=A0A0D2LMY4_HYPSF|nr:hypothetical protein HYPSUDRAFT_520232 [Hypholoma sublateritium FD-334 SS-4]
MTDEALLTNSPQQLNPRHSGGIFSHASHTVIQGGEFTIHNDIRFVEAGAGPGRSKRVKDPALEALTEHVAASAFHNSGHRIDPPRCHENTRQAVLDEIFTWIMQDAARIACIMWLNGAAGAGKSAICQSIAELCIKRGVLAASFFFFRTDPTRSSLWPLAATLAYQLMRLYPATRNLILESITSDPLIFELTFEAQFEELLVKPLLWLKNSGQVPDPKWRLVFIIDGVDECIKHTEQVALIEVFAQLVATKKLPVFVLLASRMESQLRMALGAPKVSKILCRMPLDSDYQAEKDIRLFLTDRFAAVRTTHPMGHFLERDWPAPACVQEIVTKSSGQFIYAAVVMQFVFFPRCHPARQLLDIVRGLRPSGRTTPFAQLDALYRHIFAQVEDIDLTTTLLAYIIIGQGVPDVSDIAWFFALEAVDVYLAFADLGSLVVCEGHRVRFLHASLPDSLVDAARSHAYFIDVPVWAAKLAVRWFRNIAAGEMTAWHPRPLINFLESAEFTPELRECLAKFDPSQVTDASNRKKYVDEIAKMVRLHTLRRYAFP